MLTIDRLSATGLAAQELAKQHLDTAIAALAQIVESGASESARVNAAKILTEIANPPPSRLVGKRDQAQADAENAGKGSEWEGDLEFNPGKPN